MTKISDLTALTGAGVDSAADLFPIVDMSAAGAVRNKKITIDEAKIALGVPAAITELDDVPDVNAAAPSNGDVLTWDSTPGEWIPSAPVTGSTTLNGLTDVNTPTPGNGDVLTWDSTPGEWVSLPPAGAGAFVIGDATDVDTTGQATGDVLTYDGADWVPVGAGAFLIEKKTFDGTVNTYTFTVTGSPDTIELEFIGRTAQATLVANVSVRINGLSTSIYTLQRLYAQSTAAGADQVITPASSWATAFGVPGTSVTDTAQPGCGTLTIYGCQTSFYKTITAIELLPNHATSNNKHILMLAGEAKEASAVTSVTIFSTGNFVNGSTAILRGRT